MDARGQPLVLDECSLNVAETRRQFCRKLAQLLSPGLRGGLDEMQVPAADFQSVIPGVDEAFQVDTPAQIRQRPPANHRGHGAIIAHQPDQRFPRFFAEPDFSRFGPQWHERPVKVQE